MRHWFLEVICDWIMYSIFSFNFHLWIYTLICYYFGIFLFILYVDFSKKLTVSFIGLVSNFCLCVLSYIWVDVCAKRYEDDPCLRYPIRGSLARQESFYKNRNKTFVTNFRIKYRFWYYFVIVFNSFTQICWLLMLMLRF